MIRSLVVWLYMWFIIHYYVYLWYMYVLSISWFLVILRCRNTGPTATLGISTRKAPPGPQELGITLTGAERREWMGMGEWEHSWLLGIIPSFPAFSTSKHIASQSLESVRRTSRNHASICLGLHRSVEPSPMCLRSGAQDAIRKPSLPEKEWNSLHGMLEIGYQYVDIYIYVLYIHAHTHTRKNTYTIYIYIYTWTNMKKKKNIWKCTYRL